MGGRRVRIGCRWDSRWGIVCFTRTEVWKLTYQSWKNRSGGSIKVPDKEVIIEVVLEAEKVE